MVLIADCHVMNVIPFLYLEWYGIPMNVLVMYDSNFGNTKRIAESIATEIGTGAKILHVSKVTAASLENIKLLIAGSPINGWRPTEAMMQFLSGLQKGQLKGLSVASFDTRIRVFFHGDATKKIAESLKKAGATVIVQPEAFYVLGKEGPLAEGEIERAKQWAKKTIHAVPSV